MSDSGTPILTNLLDTFPVILCQFRVQNCIDLHSLMKVMDSTLTSIAPARVAAVR